MHIMYSVSVSFFCRTADTRTLERTQEGRLCAEFNGKLSSFQKPEGKAKLLSLYNRRLQDKCIIM